MRPPASTATYSNAAANGTMRAGGSDRGHGGAVHRRKPGSRQSAALSRPELLHRPAGRFPEPDLRHGSALRRRDHPRRVQFRARSGGPSATGSSCRLPATRRSSTLIGTTYGGDGQNTFALPDLRGRVPISQGQNPSLQNYVIGQVGGSETVTLTVNQIPSHTHPVDTSGVTGALKCRTGTPVANQRTPVGNVHAVEAAGVTMPYSSATPDAVMNADPVVITGNTAAAGASGGHEKPSAVPHDELLHLAVWRLPEPVMSPSTLRGVYRLSGMALSASSCRLSRSCRSARRTSRSPRPPTPTTASATRTVRCVKRSSRPT